MASLRQNFVTLIAGRNARAMPVMLGLLALSLLVLMVLAGLFGPPAVTRPAFSWADGRPAALAAADRPPYSQAWEKLDDKPYPNFSDYLADQLQANRASAAAAQGAWRGGALDSAGLRTKGRAIAGTEDDVVRLWTQDFLCPVRDWGASAEGIRALVARGLGDCSFTQRWQARAPAFSGGSAGLGWLWLGLAAAAFLLCLLVFGVVALLRQPYAWLYQSRIL